MNFVSVAFLLLYVAALSARFCFSKPQHNDAYLTTLLVLSLVFYGWHVPAYILLLVSTVCIHYFAALAIERHRENPSATKLILFSSIIISLGTLGYFKYAKLFKEWVGLNSESSETWLFVLPAAISFYIFQSIAYSVDVYRNHLNAERKFSRLLLFLGFFPQLVAGPIVRGSQFLYQFTRTRKPRLKVFMHGAGLIIRGLFLKMVVADNLGVIVDGHWSKLATDASSAPMIITVALFFSVQLLCDFMAYTDIARGLAYQLGFRLPINFNAPFLATTFSGFWRRWHITLSSWFRDYIYIPLGGNRGGLSRNLAILLAVFIISGLWHGAKLTFIYWGLFNGLFLVIETIAIRRFIRPAWRGVSSKLKSSTLKSPIELIGKTTWFITVQLSWVLSLIYFRSTDINQAERIFSNIFNGSIGDFYDDNFKVFLGLVLCAPIVLMHLRVALVERSICSPAGVRERALMTGIMLALTVMFYVPGQAFIYFQF